MADSFGISKLKKSPTRKLSALPRFGIYFEIFGRRFTYKRAPILETLVLLKERGFTLAHLMSASIEQLDEIRFPALKPSSGKPIKKKKKSRST